MKRDGYCVVNRFISELPNFASVCYSSHHSNPRPSSESQNVKYPHANDAYDAKERPILELAERLDSLASSGQDAQDVESNL